MGRITVGVIVASWVIPISLLINHIVPHPYMDEIFHIPQTQEYCKANFRSWDPMITTPPGLYYLSLAHVASLFPGMLLLGRASSFSDLCSTVILRSVNGALAVLCSILIYEIITHLKPTLDRKKATLFAVVLSLYPLHWFFALLFYTDVASLTVFLGMYLASLKKKHLFSALLGAVAICIRQTNVIWMLFVVCSSVIEMLLVHQKHSSSRESEVSDGEEVSTTSEFDSAVKTGLRRRKSSVNVPTPGISSRHEADISKSYLPGLIDEIYDMLFRAWHLKMELVVSFSPFVLVLGLFVAFVYYNGSIVLGAKEAHTVSPHFAQIMYFALVSALFSAPFHFTFSRVFGLLRTLWKSRPLSFAFVFVAFAVGLLSVHFFSIAHPYLLADNRHYTFYIWRKVINPHWSMKYALVPLYVYSWLSILDILGKTRSKIWVLVYFLASVAVLVPTPLIEFRYYTIPFIIFMLNCGIEETSKWLVTGIVYIVINVFTLYMFLYRPFYWALEPDFQRFLW
ncbi:hypothetical protein RND81_12G012200 [Saponaria officinalis]|uniref:Dol-P-Glc:Glc(2)Man(9)GlcNAc(2)-PP-Dol alpha-1,2-glucosyltransferase n=1 Tax=Saponaria officinalis TaxID=3572 RepID=A0AAW1H673_SAPOF